jgi:hypothetical protein
VCDVEITVATVEGLDAPDAIVAHEDHCPLLRAMQERPPGLARVQAVLRPEARAGGTRSARTA